MNTLKKLMKLTKIPLAVLFAFFVVATIICAPIILNDNYGTGQFVSLSIVIFLIICAPMLVVFKRKILKNYKIYAVGIIVLVFCGVGLVFWAMANILLLDVVMDSLAGKLDKFLTQGVEPRMSASFDFMFISLGFIIAVGSSLFGAFIACIVWLFLHFKEKSKG